MRVYNSPAGGTVLQQTCSKEAEASEKANVSCRRTWFVSLLLVHVSFNVDVPSRTDGRPRPIDAGDSGKGEWARFGIETLYMARDHGVRMG
jgi:hypothetical protein